jgi:DNA-binding transcriptional MerR regulator
MEYMIQKLAKMAGVSTRTLRYYDEIGLLKPARINSSGYRIYGQKEVDLLQLILFYRELDVELEDIKKIVTSKSFDELQTLKDHHAKLMARKERIDLLIKNVEKTIKVREGAMTMSDKEKFEGFIQSLIDENEKEYGKEIREKYGAGKVEKPYSKLKSMTPEQFEEVERLNAELSEALKAAIKIGDAASEPAQRAAQLHKKWISYFWDSYSKEAHAGVARMYVDDERFTAYYDKIAPGAAKLLRDAVLIYTGMEK